MPKVRHSPRPNKNLSQRIEQGNNGKAIEQAAKAVGTNRQYVADAKAIQEKAPEVLKAVRNPPPSEDGGLIPRSIAEKNNSTYFEDPLKSFADSQGLSLLIAEIIGDNTTVKSRIPETQASRLAYLLTNIRHELSAGDQQMILRLLNDAIELCFLHTPVYEAVAEVCRLEDIGELLGAESTIEALQNLIDHSNRLKPKKGDNQYDEENQSQ